MGEPLIRVPEPDSDRIDALWTSAAPFVLVREREKRRQKRLATGAFAMALVIGLMAWQLSGPQAAVDQAGFQLSADTRPSTFSLSDGSRVDAEVQTMLSVERLDDAEVRLDLVRGRASFAVTKKRARTFSVQAGDVTVRVVGTRFTIIREGEQVKVEVEEGVVEVEHDGRVARVKAAESWTRATVVRPPEPEAEEAEVEPSPAPPMDPPVVDSPRTRRKIDRTPHSDTLFQKAMDARKSGDHGGARQALAEFIDRFPRDARVGLAAFELGRLEMDVAHDMDAAVRQLTRALAAAPHASFAEDALARLARAHNARGDRRACREARTLYAERHPTGAYATSLAALCP